MGARSFTGSLGVCLAVLALAACGGSSHHGQQGTAGTHAAATTTGQQGSGKSSSGHKRSGTTPSRASGSSASGKLAHKLTRYYGDLATYGSEASGAQRAAILSAFDAYFHAVSAGDWSAMCARLSASAQRNVDRLLQLTHLPRMGCAAALKKLSATTPPAARRAQLPISVFAVRANGSRAFVLYRTRQLRHAFFPMVNEGGAWRATALTGSNL